MDSSLFRGEGGMMVTLGPAESVLSRSDEGALLTEALCLCETLALETEMVGWPDRDVGDGDGDLAPSR